MPRSTFSWPSLHLVKVAIVGLAFFELFGASDITFAASQAFGSLPINSGTSTAAVSVTIPNGGTLASVKVVTQGAAGVDFGLSSAGSCTVGSTFSGPSSCTVSVSFTPRSPGTRLGAVVLVSNSGAVMGEQTLTGNGLGSLGVLTPATITTVAGNGQWLYTGDGGAATNAPIFLPAGVAVDPSGNVYIADSENNRVRLVTFSTGIITTVAGIGSPSSASDGGLGVSAGVSDPGALLLDGAGDLYIADSSNHAIRKLSLTTGRLTTVAGQLNQQGYSGDGGPATSATLNTPEGLALDPSGNLYIADTKNHVIRKVDLDTGLISTYAGVGAPGYAGDGGLAVTAKLNAPWGIATDPLGNLFIADLNNNRVRQVSTIGLISTVVGTGTTELAMDGQSGPATPINNPAAVAVDVAGNLYVADSGHNIVRKVNAATGLATAIAGTSSPTFMGDNGPATMAGLYGPYALTLDGQGNLYIADIFHHRIREVQNSQSTLSFQPIRVGRTSAPQPQNVENDGNQPLNFLALSPDGNSSVDTATTTCAVGTPLAQDATCVVGAAFSPQTTGTTVMASLQIQSDAVNSPATIQLSGEVDELEPTRTTILSSANPSALGGSVSFTANVTSGATQPSGNIRFYDGTTLLGTVGTDANGSAIFTTTALALGSHAITANFTGDALNSPSVTMVLTQVVKRNATVALTSSLNPSKVSNNVVLTASVTATSAEPTGTVVFMDGTTVLASVALSSGTATFSVSSLIAGTHNLSATYSGDTSTLAGNVATLDQTVAKWASSAGLGSSNASSTLGSSVTFSVAVTSTSTVVPSGTVVLKDGAAILATLAPLDGTGAVSFSTSSLSVGMHTILASYSGDATNGASDSVPFQQTIQQIDTTTTLASSANPANGGANIHLTAKVLVNSSTSVTDPLTGTVTFRDGSNLLGTANVAVDGSCTLDSSALAVASHSIVASYSGNTDYAGSSSVALSQQVVLAATSVQLTSSQTSVVTGNNIVLTAVLAGNGAIPTGLVTFYDGTVSLGTATLNSAGQATLTPVTFSAGTHRLSASYQGDSADSGSVSAAINETVSPATTAITLTSSSNPALAGVSLTFVANLTSNGSIPAGSMLLRDGSTSIGNGLISATGSVQFTLSTLSPQSHSLTAYYAGDANHLASTSVVVVQVVQLATSTATVLSNQNPGILGSPITFTANVNGTGVQPTGTVNFLDGGTALSSAPLLNGVAIFTTSALTIGAHQITATYAGDPTHSASSNAMLTETMQQNTATTIVSSTNPAIVGGSVSFTATVNGAIGSGVSTSATNNAAITGSVQFYDGATLLGSAPLSASGLATYQTTMLSAGTHLVFAMYQGDQNDRGSTSGALSQAMNTADTTITLASSLNPSIVGKPVTFSAGISSRGQPATGVVTFLDGSLVLGSVPVSSGAANFTMPSLTAGLHAIIARYNGDSATQSSTSSVLLQVAQQSTAISLVPSLNPMLTAQSVTLSATFSNGSNPTGTLTFLDGGVILGTATVSSSGSAAITVPSLAAGTHSLSVSYNGDSYNLPSTSSSVTELVQLRTSTTSMTASSQGYLAGQQVTLVAVVHYTGPVVPTGTVSFVAGGQVIGSSSVSNAAAATLTINPTASQYDIVAVYSGDNVYSMSTAADYSITQGTSTTFSITSDPPSLSLKSGDHQQITLTLNSTNNFTDTLSFGCLNLPPEATCTFSSDKSKLDAGGTAAVTVVFDTGNPLGSGAASSATAASRKSQPSSIVGAAIWAPAAFLLSLLLVFARRGRRLHALLPLLLLAVTGLTVTGCGNHLNTTTTPPGSYTVQVIATGTQTSISQIANITVTVQ